MTVMDIQPGTAASEFVKYGDTITMYSVAHGGFVASQGIVDERISVGVLESKGLVPPNLHECRFIVYNKFQYASYKAYKKEVSRRGSTIDDLDPDSKDYSLISTLKLRAQEEKRNNETEFKRLGGEYVAIGSIVQLKHSVSDKFVTLKKLRAEHDSKAMKVTLESTGSESSWFVVSQGYKSQAEGDRVAVNEVLTFKSVKFANMSLHISQDPMPFENLKMPRYTSRLLELNAFTEASKLRVIPYAECPLLVPQAAQSLKGGDIVSLYHLELEAYLCVEDERLVFKHKPRTADTPSNAVWKFESSRIQRAGDVCRWATHNYRLQNVASGLFIAVEGNMVGLTDMYNTEQTNFTLHPGTRAKSDAVLYESMFTLKSAASSLFLSGTAGDRSGLASDMCAVAALCEEQLDSDVLHAQPVEGEEYSRIVVVREALGVLNDFIESMQECPSIKLSRSDEKMLLRVKKSPLKAVVVKHSAEVQATLAKLIGMCTQLLKKEDPTMADGPPITHMQSLLAEQNAISIVMQVLSMPIVDKKVPLALFDIEKGGPYGGAVFLRIAQLAFSLIRALVKTHGENQQRMAGHIPFVRSLLGTETKAAAALLEIFRDNRKLLRKVSESDVRDFLVLMQQQKKPRFVLFLAAICKCESIPLAVNQNRIVSELMPKCSEVFPSLNFEVLGDGQARVIVRMDNIEIPLNSFAGQTEFINNKSPMERTDEENLYMYYLACMQLYSDLCFGRNKGASDTLIRNSDILGVSYGSLLACVQQRSLPNAVRSSAGQLLMSLYLDRDPCEPLPAIKLTRMWKRVLPKDAEHYDSFERNHDLRQEVDGMEDFEDLKDYMLHYFESLGPCMDSGKLSKNKLTLQLLQLLEMLVVFGFYSKPSKRVRAEKEIDVPAVRKLLLPLLAILDGRSDRFTLLDEDADNARFHSVDSRIAVLLDCKLQILRILSYFFDQRADVRLSLFLEKFEEIFEESFPRVDRSRLKETKSLLGGLKGIPGVGIIGSGVGAVTGLLTGAAGLGAKAVGAVGGKALNMLGGGLAMGLKMIPGVDVPIGDSEAARARRRKRRFKKRKDVKAGKNTSKIAPLDALGAGMNALTAGAKGLGGLVGIGESEEDRVKGQIVRRMQFLEEASSWHDSPVWTEEQIEDLEDDMFAEPVLHEATHLTDDLDHPPRFVEILLDLLRYEYRPLTNMAFELLSNHMSQKAKFISSLLKAQVLVYPDIVQAFLASRAQVSRLRSEVKWVLSEDTKRRDEARQICSNILEFFRDLCVPGSEPLIADEQLFITSNNKQKYQTFLRNLNAHEAVIEIIKLPLDTTKASTAGQPDLPTDPHLRDLFARGYSFLEAFVADEPDNQAAVFKSRDLFCQHLGVEGINIPPLISKCTKNNRQLLNLVDETFARMFMRLIVDYGQNPAWLRFFEDFVVMGEFEIKKNQSLVSKMLVEYDSQVLVLFSGTQGREERLWHMKQKNPLGVSAKLVYHIMCIRLIAACCRGRNPDSQNKARALVPLPEIMFALMDLQFHCAADGTRDKQSEPRVSESVTNAIRHAYFDILRCAWAGSDTEAAKVAMRSERNRLWSIDCDDPEAKEKYGEKALMELIFDELFELAKHYATQQPLMPLVRGKAANGNKDGRKDGRNGGGLLNANNSKSRGGRWSGSSRGKSIDIQENENDDADWLGLNIPNMSDVEELVLGSIVPFLTSLYKVHFSGRFCDDAQSEMAEQMTRVVASFRDLVPERFKPTILEYLNVMAEKHGLTDFVDPDESDVQAATKSNGNDSIIDDDEPEEDRFLFNSGWSAFLSFYASAIGVKDLSRMLDTGSRDMALMFAKNCIVPGSVPETNFREVLFNMFRQLSHRRASVPAQQLISFLRMCRAMIYLDDPDPGRSMIEHSADWQRFVDNEPPSKSEPSDKVLEWVQDKFVSLGMSLLGVRLVSHQDSQVQDEAAKLLNTLLTNGNKGVQDTIFSQLSGGMSPEFFASLKTLLHKAIVDVREYRRQLKRRVQEKTSQQTSRKTKRFGIDLSGISKFGKGLLDQGKNLVGQGNDTKRKKSGRGTARSATGEAGNGQQSSSAGGNIDWTSQGTVMEVLALLRWLSEGHHHDLQNALRVQPFNSTSHDLLLNCVSLLESIQPVITDALMEGDHRLSNMVTAVANCLSEACQGPCEANQIELVNSNLLPVMDRMLSSLNYDSFEGARTSPNGETALDASCKIRNSLLEVCLALLEACSSPTIPNTMYEMLSITRIRDQVTWVHDLLFRKSISKKFENVLGNMSPETLNEGLHEELFNNYFLLCTLMDWNRTKVQSVRVVLQRDDVWSYLEENSGVVEVVRNNRLERVRYRIPDYCVELHRTDKWRASMESKMFDVPRDNPQEKSIHFLSKMTDLSFEIHHSSVIQKNKLGWLVTRYRRVVEDAPFWTAAAIMCLLMMFYGSPFQPYEVLPAMRNIVFVVGLVHIGLTVFFFATFLVTEVPIIVYHKRRRRQLKKDAKEQEAKGGLTDLPNGNEAIDVPEHQKPIPDPPQPPKKASRFSWTAVFRSGRFYWMCTYVALSLAAGLLGDLWEFAPFLYCFPLLDYFRMPEGMVVVQSLVVGGPKLMKTASMAVIILLCYGTIGFVAFHLDITDGSCDTFYQCVNVHVMSGLINGGFSDVYDKGSGTALTNIPEAMWQDMYPAVRTLFLLSFYLIWVYLLANIITGQIIEAFAQIRGQKNLQSQDSKDKCFICSIDRFTLQQQTSGFEWHVKEEHNPWDYMFFIIYLVTKPSVDMSGVESYVMGRISAKDHEWLPVSRAMSIENSSLAISLAPGASVQSEELGPKQANKAKNLAQDERIRNMEQTVDDLKVMLSGMIASLNSAGIGKPDSNSAGIVLSRAGSAVPLTARLEEDGQQELAHPTALGEMSESRFAVSRNDTGFDSASDVASPSSDQPNRILERKSSLLITPTSPTAPKDGSSLFGSNNDPPDRVQGQEERPSKLNGRLELPSPVLETTERSSIQDSATEADPHDSAAKDSQQLSQDMLAKDQTVSESSKIKQTEEHRAAAGPNYLQGTHLPISPVEGPLHHTPAPNDTQQDTDVGKVLKVETSSSSDSDEDGRRGSGNQSTQVNDADSVGQAPPLQKETIKQDALGHQQSTSGFHAKTPKRRPPSLASEMQSHPPEQPQQSQPTVTSPKISQIADSKTGIAKPRLQLRPLPGLAIPQSDADREEARRRRRAKRKEKERHSTSEKG